MQKHKESFFITFEGIEGSGKTTQIKKLELHLKSMGYDVLLLREPGGSVFGEKIREALLNSEVSLHPMAEAFSFAASRSQLIFEKILPHLMKAKTAVLIDRYMDSSIAYQGFARGLGLETIVKLHEYSPLNLRPDLTFYLRIDLATSELRQAKRGNHKDYFEKENAAFYGKLIQGYDECAKAFPARVKTINADDSEENVFNQIIKYV